MPLEQGQAWDPDFEKLWGEIIAKSWSDPGFRSRMEQNPKEILQQDYQISYPDGVLIFLGSVTQQVPPNDVGIVLPWPPKPSDLEVDAAPPPPPPNGGGGSKCCCCSLLVCSCC